MADEARSLKAYGELPESSACPAPQPLQRAAAFRPRVWRESSLLRCTLRCRRTRHAAAFALAPAARCIRVHGCCWVAWCCNWPLTHLRFLSLAVRVNETDTFDEERGENDDFFDFDDVAEI